MISVADDNPVTGTQVLALIAARKRLESDDEPETAAVTDQMIERPREASDVTLSLLDEPLSVRCLWRPFCVDMAHLEQDGCIGVDGYCFGRA
jgi:hypothetical protein